MWHRAVPVLLLTACCTICKALTDCTSDPLELTFLVDLTPTETGHFELLKERIRQVVRLLERSTLNRTKSYSLIGFHRRPVSFLELAAPNSADSQRFIVELLSLENIPQFAEETSVARALNAATVQFKKDGSPNARRVVFLAHDGINSDLVAETLEAVDSLKALNAHIFAIAAGPNNNGFALEGYTGHRSRVYADPGDVTTFEQALDLVTGACPSQLPETLVEQLVQSRKFALRALDSPRIKSTFSPDQECPRVKVDLMIVLDTSGSVHNAFDAERAFAVDLIKQFEEKAFEQDINVGLVRFASSADLLLPLTSGKTRAEILQKIMDIPFTGSNTKIASAVDLGVQTLQRYQREDAEQVFVLISDGHGQEFWNVVQATGKRLQQQDWEIFSVTASKDYNLAELTMYTGDASRVFIGPKSASFLPVVGKYINKCISEENKQKKTEEQRTKPPKDKTEAMEGSGVQDADCDLDIVLVVDRSQSVESDYQHELKTARDIVNLASADAFDSGKVKVGVTSFARDSNVELPLEKRPRQSVSDTIGAIFHTGGTTSAVKGVNEALKSLIPFRRPSARLILVLISDGHSQDFWKDLTLTSSKVQALPNSLFLAATNSEKYSLSELRTWTGKEENVYHSGQIPHFLERLKHEMYKCGAQIEGSGEFDGSGEDMETITVDNVSEASSSDVKEPTDEIIPTDPHTEKTRGVNVLKEVASKVEKMTEELLTDATTTAAPETPQPFDGKGPCSVDLIFVIDVSTSVESEFEKQRQFTVNLVSRLPSEDFAHRVHVGVVAFNDKAKVTARLDESKSKEALLDTLQNVTNIGGSTSVAAGMRLAGEELLRARRSNARQMIVLVSDGNSQDYWRDVVSSSSFVKKTGADVYAITVHKDYLFRELEMYATNRWFVYVDARIRHFLAETETALRQCLSPPGGQMSQ